MKNKTSLQKLFVGMVVLSLFFMVSTSVTVQAADVSYDLQEEDILDSLDCLLNVTAEIVEGKATRTVSFTNARAIVGTSKLLAPIFFQEIIKQGAKAMFQPALINLPVYWDAIKAGKIPDSKLLLTGTIKPLTRTDNDSADFGGVNNVFQDTFSIKDDLEATTTVSFNSSDATNWGVMEPEYREYEDILSSNTSETDFTKTSTYEDSNDYQVQVTGFENLETEFLTTIEANIAANQSTLPEYVHVTSYEVNSANKSTHLSEDFVSAIRRAESASVSAVVSYMFLGIPLVQIKDVVPVTFFQPVGAVISAANLRDTIGRVVDFGKFFVSKTLPTITNKISSTVTNTISKVQNTLKPVVHAALKAPSTIIKNVQSAVGSAVSGVKTFVSKVGTGVTGMITNTVGGVTSFVSNAVGGIVGGIKGIISGVISFLPFLLLGLIAAAVLVAIVYVYIRRDDIW